MLISKINFTYFYNFFFKKTTIITILNILRIDFRQMDWFRIKISKAESRERKA